MSLDEGRPLLSGSAEAKAHSSSSSLLGGAGAEVLAGGVGLMKSNMDEVVED